VLVNFHGPRSVAVCQSCRGNRCSRVESRATSWKSYTLMAAKTDCSVTSTPAVTISRLRRGDGRNPALRMPIRAGQSQVSDSTLSPRLTTSCSPAYVFPLKAKDGGVLKCKKAGRADRGGCRNLARLHGVIPAGS